VSAAEWEIYESQRNARDHERSTISTIGFQTANPLPIYSPTSPESYVGALSNTISQLMNFEPPLAQIETVVKLDVSSPALEYLDAAVKLAHVAIDNVIAALANGSPLTDRLHDLVDMARDEYPETDIPSYTSIVSLGRLLSEFPRMRTPDISLLPTGSLWLSWATQGVQSGLSIFRDGTVSFGLVVTGTGRPAHINFAGPVQSVIPRIMREDAVRGLIS
jgi:hypothetical protein